MELNKKRLSEFGDPDAKTLKLEDKENIMKGTFQHANTGSHLTDRLFKIENDQQRDLVRSTKAIDSKINEIQRLRQDVMTLKTQRANAEFENYKLDDELMIVKDDLNIYVDQIEEIKQHESESLESLQDKYELTTKRLKLMHQLRLEKLKESASSEIEESINSAINMDQKERDDLRKLCFKAEEEIKAQEQDLNRTLIKMKEESNKRLIQQSNLLTESIHNSQIRISSLKLNLTTKRSSLESLKSRLRSSLDEEGEKRVKQLRHLETNFLDRQNEINELNDELKHILESIDREQDAWLKIASKIEEHKSQEKDIYSFLESKEMKRRDLHERLQSLKGNIRVYCRIRPANCNEELSKIELSSDEVNISSNQELVISKQAELTGPCSRSSDSYLFQFDKIFSSALKNKDIFGELSQLVQSSLDGSNVSVFAYGQTGSGKTYTMLNQNDGMIPLTMKKIFDDIEELKKKNWIYQVKGQFLEIYNETIIDLLSSSPSNKLEIKHDDIKERTTVTNLTQITLSSRTHANLMLDRAIRGRTTGATKLNERSSRSHCIFIFTLKGRNLKTGEECIGTLNLIDLAGSERVSNSQVRGERLQETQAINKSLSALGDVICAIGQQQTNNGRHVPYRNSKLTFLLKHSLGGSAKTLMFVNISPLLKDFTESVNSLRFATKVNSIKLKSRQD